MMVSRRETVNLLLRGVFVVNRTKDVTSAELLNRLKAIRGAALRTRAESNNCDTTLRIPRSTLNSHYILHNALRCKRSHSANFIHTEIFHLPHCWPGSQLFSSTEFVEKFHCVHVRYITTSRPECGEKSEPTTKPSSKVEVAVKAIEENLKETEKNAVVVPKRSILKRIQDELLHYYHGFRLLFIDITISAKLVWRILKGNTLSRREHRQLIRTTSDVFRLVPFSVFIIVPFMEFLLPVFLKFFPGMLPSTFQTTNDKEDKMKKELKVKLDMAKFLQQTLDEMAPQAKGRSSQGAKDFAQFIDKIRTSGAETTNAEILKYSKLFEDEITLDSLSRAQLTALCHVVELSAIGNTAIIRFQLKMRLRTLVADDKVIEKEGVARLNISELQYACKARGMRAMGVPEDRLRRQLEQWLQLSLHEKVPPSLLLLSRAMYLTDNLPDKDQLQATLQALPEAATLQTKGAIGEREGRVDNKTRIAILKEEEKRIKEEQHEEQLKAAQEKALHQPPQPVRQEAMGSPADPPFSTVLGPQAPSTSIVPDTIQSVLSRQVPFPLREAQTEQLTSTDLNVLESAINDLGAEKKKLIMEKEELDDLKEEIQDYKEDVQDLKSLRKTSGAKVQVKESKGAKILFKKLNAMISQIDGEIKASQPDAEPQAHQFVSIAELMDTIKKFQKDKEKLSTISELLDKLDDNHDGKIEVDDIVKLVELIGREKVSLTSKQLEEAVSLLYKEEHLEEEAEKHKSGLVSNKAQQESKELPR